MDSNQQRIQYLLIQFSNNTATRAEFDELFAIIRTAGAEEEIKAELLNSLENNNNQQQYAETLDRILQTILRKEQSEVPVRRLNNWKRYVAAASVIGLLFFAGYWLFNNKESNNGKQDQKTAAVTNDVPAPDKTKAVITLSNGQTISLDSLTTLTQEDVVLTKTNEGGIKYNDQSAAGSGLIKYNTVYNPRGSKVVAITLADGSAVWLNAGSSITYPVAFTGIQRKVQINGEAYFEIAHNKQKPFIVSKGDMDVTVLGTHFNVNAYDDEEAIKVTLLEGSVKIQSGAGSLKSVVIKPGQQAIVLSGVEGSQLTTQRPDLNQVMAWKSGRFYFDGADIKTIMRQLARWYDLEVEYRANIPYTFVAKIDRTVPLTEMLKLLELTGGVHFIVEGKKLVVTR